MSFPRQKIGIMSIVDRVSVELENIGTMPTYGTMTVRKEGFIMRVRAECKNTLHGLPFELSFYEKNPEGIDGVDGPHRIVTYRVNEPNVTVFANSTQYTLDSVENIYYSSDDLKKSMAKGFIYYSIKTLSGVATSVEIKIEITVAGSNGNGNGGR